MFYLTKTIQVKEIYKVITGYKDGTQLPSEFETLEEAREHFKQVTTLPIVQYAYIVQSKILDNWDRTGET